MTTIRDDSGKVVLHVAENTPRVPNVPFVDKCPNCGAEVQDGYGLAYGGMGSYQFCTQCDWATKHPEPEDA